jgi:hypothetical protein
MSSERDIIFNAIGSTFLFVLTLVVAWAITTSIWKQRAVDHGSAAYDSQTGEWRWNDEAAIE